MDGLARASIEATTELAVHTGQLDLATDLIAMLDEADGDELDEADGDELDGTGAEDDFMPPCGKNNLAGPGCPFSDPDYAVDDLPCDPESDF